MNNIQVGSVSIAGQTILAPMAGFTDLPYRKICRQWGAAYAVAEMAASKDNLQHTAKTSFRMNLDGEPSPRGIQLIGSVPEELARAAKRAENAGADIVDLNCGCPAKKVCSVACERSVNFKIRFGGIPSSKYCECRFRSGNPQVQNWVEHIRY